MTRIGEQLENLVNEKVANGLFGSVEQAIHEIECLLSRKEIQQNLKVARSDIESGNLLDAEIVFKELQNTDI